MPVKPAVSVVVPAYNMQAYLRDTLASVLAQRHTDFEVLVVDDGSSDATADIARATGDARVRLISQANRGLAGARNTGIRHAQGRYIALLDADDLWHPDKLAAHVAHLESSSEVGVSYSQSAFVHDDGSAMGYAQHPKLRDISARDVFLRNPVGNGSAPVFRREVFDDIAHASDRPGELNYFDESFRQSEDIECWMRIALLTRWRFEGIGRELTLYRVNAGGLSAQLDRQFQSWERMVAKMAQYAPEFTRSHVALARAYQYRYLARRAVRNGSGTQALRLWRQAVASAPAICWQEPARTGATLAAALVRLAVTDSVYAALERLAMRGARR